MTTQNNTNLLWIDLEMTGLEEEIHHIIEIASIITDSDLNILEKGPNIAIFQSDDRLALMDDWCVKTHGESGLIERIKNSKVSLEMAEQKTLQFVKKWIPEKCTPLCGNSIGTDRRFLKKYMKSLDQYCHYRNIDVSSFKEIISRWYPDKPHYQKKNTHLALEDIIESVEELKFYKENYFQH